MKKVNLIKSALFLILFIGSISPVSAQLEKGNWMVGGYGSFGISRSSLNLSLAPSAGYFFRTKTAIGASISNSFYRYKSNNEVFTAYGLSVNPFVRHYFLNPEKKFNVFGQVGASFSSRWASPEPFVSHTSLDLSAGISYFFTPQIALEFRTEYTPNILSNSKSNLFNLRSNLGFQIFF